MELKQLISVDYLRENFTEGAGRIARYGEDPPPGGGRLRASGALPGGRARGGGVHRCRAPALRRGEKADGPQAQQYRERGVCYLL